MQRRNRCRSNPHRATARASGRSSSPRPAGRAWSEPVAVGRWPRPGRGARGRGGGVRSGRRGRRVGADLARPARHRSAVDVGGDADRHPVQGATATADRATVSDVRRRPGAGSGGRSAAGGCEAVARDVVAGGRWTSTPATPCTPPCRASPGPAATGPACSRWPTVRWRSGARRRSRYWLTPEGAWRPILHESYGPVLPGPDGEHPVVAGLLQRRTADLGAGRRGRWHHGGVVRAPSGRRGRGP